MKLIIYDSVFPYKTESSPILSLKPDTTLLRNNNAFFIPDFSNEIEYGLFLVLKIGKMGKCISSKFAHRYYDEIGVAVNFTAKDVLKKCVEKQIPIEPAYAFDNSSAISPEFLRKAEIPVSFTLSLKINQNEVFQVNTGNFSEIADTCIAEVSKNITLKIGDYLLLGCTGGKGMIKKEDRFQGFLDQNLLLDFNIQ